MTATAQSTGRSWRWLLPLSSVVLVIALWWLIARFGPISSNVFPGPVQVARAAAEYPASRLTLDIGISMLRVAIGFMLALVLGVLLGTLTGASRVMQRLLHGPLELLRPIPPLAWITVAIIWLGLGEGSKVFIIFMAAFFPIYVAAFRGIKDVDPMLVEASRTLGVTQRGTLLRVLLPAAAPDIATGIRIGWGVAFTALVGAEVIAGESGLGFMIMDARAIGEIPVIVYGIFLIGLLGWTTDALIQKVLMERVLAWHFRAEH
ncbi:MAG: ABC transporter permease [Beutenbergiaceae bacterium]